MTQSFSKEMNLQSPGKLKVLVAEDDLPSLIVASRWLEKEGFEVKTAEDGLIAAEMFATQHFDMLVTDWMMPELDGVQLTRFVKTKKPETYVIMLTAKSDKDSIVMALDCGVNDFLSKPYDANEFRARTRAAQRVVEIQKQLSSALSQLDQSLASAAEAQQRLLPQIDPQLPGIEFAWHYKAAEYVGGDTFQIIPLPDSTVSFFLADVMGHGPAASMLSAAVNYMLRTSTTAYPEQTENKNDLLQNPDSVLDVLNSRFPISVGGRFFTIVFANYDPAEKVLKWSGAAHPPIIIIKPDGKIRKLEISALPIGVVQGTHYDLKHENIEPGSRIIFYSDGITECPDANGEEFGEKRLITHFQNNRTSSLQNTINGLGKLVIKHNPAPPDDISILVMESK